MRGKDNMPTYEYECKSCEHHFELFQMMSEPPKKRCPACGKAVQRLIGTGTGIMFKGSGFYETDYKRAKAPKSETKNETKSEPKSEAKPAENKPPTEKKDK